MRQDAKSIWPWGALAVISAAMLFAGLVVPSLPLGIAGAVLGTPALWVLAGRPGRTETSAPSEKDRSPERSAQTVPRVPPGLEPTVVLAALRDACADIAPVVAAHLWLSDEPTATLRQIAAVGPMAPTRQPISISADDVLASTCASGRAELSPIARVRGPGDSMVIWRYAIPVTAGDSCGVAGIDFQSDSEPDVEQLPQVTSFLRGALAGTLGLHVANIELTTAQTLIDAARDLSRMLDPDSVLSIALTRAMQLSQAQTGSVMLLDPVTGSLSIALAEGLSSEVVESTSLSEGEGIAGWVLASRQPVLIEDLPGRSTVSRRNGVRSAVSVPIADEDGILGVLNVGSKSFPARFTESHMSSMELLGKQTAIALRNARAVVESRTLYFDTLKALAIALETKDPYSRGGTERVLEYADALGTAFDLEPEEHDALRIAALLHDIGMAAAGEGITLMDRPLTTVERALLKLHPQVAAEMLAEGPALKRVVPIVYHHHEWYDGEGYLGGVSGERIPLGARILAVADAYVAMTSERPYRSAFSQRDALDELTAKAGTQFDPAVVDALCDILRNGSNRVPGSSA